MIDAEFGLTSEVRVSLDATAGVFDGDKETLELSEGITVSSTDGYAAKLDTAMVDLRARTLVSEGNVEISSTEGLIRSRALSISDRGKKISFTGGVSMTFVPPVMPEASGETAAPPAAESE
jgi:lipopolysaccharide export system protein LptC